MDCERLVDLVESYPVIYDTAHANYKDKRIKDEAWAAIGYELNHPPLECIQKWNVLRGQYAKELRHMARTGDASRPKWKAWRMFNKMSFIHEFVKQRGERIPRSGADCISQQISEVDASNNYLLPISVSCDGSLGSSRDDEDLMLDFDSSPGQSIKVDSDIYETNGISIVMEDPTISIIPQEPTERSTSAITISPNHSGDATTNSNIPSHCPPKQRRLEKPHRGKESSSFELQSYEQAASTAVQPQHPASTDNTCPNLLSSNISAAFHLDELDHFGLQVAKQMKSLDRSQQALAKIKIHQALYDVQFGQQK